LKDLRSLTSLMFYGCEGVTDAAARHLSGLTNLTSLWFYSEAFWRNQNWQALSLTDAGVAPLQGLKRLRHLNLHGQNLSDRSLTMISSLAVLEHLSLTGTAITDSGLIHLAGLTNLRELRLWETSVTEAGVAALKAKLPNLKIEVGDRNGRG